MLPKEWFRGSFVSLVAILFEVPSIRKPQRIESSKRIPQWEHLQGRVLALKSAPKFWVAASRSLGRKVRRYVLVKQ